MKQTVMLTIASLLSILLSADILRTPFIFLLSSDTRLVRCKKYCERKLAACR
jgi:hypothetical protein